MNVIPLRRPELQTVAVDRPRVDPGDLQRRLAHWNHDRLAVGKPSSRWRETLADAHRIGIQEGEWIEAFRREIAPLVADVPTDPDAFVTWFEDLKATGPGQGDPLFPWLAGHATMDQMKWFLTQEAAGEAGFDDLVALAQIKLEPQAKLELARNYWDEMGRGNAGGMHGPMLDRVVQTLELRPSIDETVWQSLALANAMTAFSTSRRYTYQAVGALGVVELTAPGRVAQVAAGLKRLGVPPKVRHYFDLHAILDVKHSEEWNKEALRPLVAADPDCARYLAEGAVMRLVCGARCFDAYRAHLWGARSVPA